jgi:hypothetical protein
MTTEEVKSVSGVFRCCWKPIRRGTLLLLVLVVGAVCYWYIDRRRLALPRFRQGEKLVIWEAASTPDVSTSPPKTEWKLLSGLALLSSSIDVSADRKLAIVWGERKFGNETRKSCWLIDLQTAEIEDLSTTSNGKVAAIVRDPARATFSPDGKHLLISAQGGQTACILDHSTGNTIAISGLEHWDILWSGNRLLISSGWREHPEVFNIAGERQEQPKVRGRVIASDPSGTKLLLWYPPAVVNLEGETLREFGGHSCDKEVPLLSRSGNWAGVFCSVEDEWAYSVVSTTSDEVFRLRRPWGATFALTDNGDSIFLVGGGDSTFGAVISGGQRVEATTADVVFWPKTDDPWTSTPGAPEGPSFNDILWNAMPKGKSKIVATKVMALTLLGKELFFVQADGDERILKAISLPEAQTSSPANNGTSPTPPAR